MAAVFDFDEHHFATIFAATPGLARAFHAVVGLVGKGDYFGLGLAAVRLDPALDGVVNGPKLSDARTPQRTFTKAAIEKTK